MTFQYEDARVQCSGGTKVRNIDPHSELAPTEYIHPSGHSCSIEVAEVCPPRLQPVPVRLHQLTCLVEPVTVELLCVGGSIGAFVPSRNSNGRDAVQRVTLYPPIRFDEGINGRYWFHVDENDSQ